MPNQLEHNIHVSQVGQKRLDSPMLIYYDSLIKPDNIRQWLKDMEFAQDPMEFSKLLEVVKGSKSILEIGSRFGVTLQKFSEVLDPKSRIVAVDLPRAVGDTTMAYLDSLGPLNDRAMEIREKGHDVIVIVGDSHSDEVIERVKSYGPYDFCFIDGDHSEEGVKQDWANYGPMSKIVAFHDIGPRSVQPCRKIWPDIKNGYKTLEFTDSQWMGIGVVFREE